MTENSDQSNVAARVRQAFLDQAGYCDRFGSPFTALLCRVLGDGLEGSNEIEQYILQWPGDASTFGDSVPLRVAGALHVDESDWTLGVSESIVRKLATVGGHSWPLQFVRMGHAWPVLYKK